jgi:hypothetical protein
MSVAEWELAFVSASKLASESGAVVWEPYIQVGSKDDDVRPFGPSDVFQGLGFASMPYGKDEKGYAECLVAQIGGRCIAIGGRDTRTANVIGNLKPGDTCVHSTGPQQAAQLQLKEEKRQCVMRTKDKQGKDMIAMLDGVNEKIQVSGMGLMLEGSRENGWNIAEPGGAAIQLHGGKVIFTGTVMLSRTPTGLVVVAPIPATPPINGAPAPGVYA